MKKIILSALAGALVMFLTIFGIAAVSVSWEQVQEPRSYVHVDYVTELTQEDCFLCGNGSGPLTSHYWSEDNVGIIKLNTFELMRLEINRYDDHGQLIEEVAGYAAEHEGVEAINLGTGNGISVLELVNAFQKVNNIELPYIIGPRRDGDLPAFWADAEKAKKLLGWEATHTVEDMCRSSWNFAKQGMNKK